MPAPTYLPKVQYRICNKPKFDIHGVKLITENRAFMCFRDPEKPHGRIWVQKHGSLWMFEEVEEAEEGQNESG